MSYADIRAIYAAVSHVLVICICLSTFHFAVGQPSNITSQALTNNTIVNKLEAIINLISNLSTANRDASVTNKLLFLAEITTSLAIGAKHGTPLLLLYPYHLQVYDSPLSSWLFSAGLIFKKDN